MNNLIFRPAFFVCLLPFLFSCSSDPGFYANGSYGLRFDERKTGVIEITHNGVNLLSLDNANQPLFNVRMRDRDAGGAIVERNAADAADVEIKRSGGTITLIYSGFPEADMRVTVRVVCRRNSPLMHWRIAVDNHTPYYIDHIDFPILTLRNDLIATGGSGRLLWPAQEGCLVEDLRIREEGPGPRNIPIETPHIGWGGFYPAATQVQMMAYYNDRGGLYLATHDPFCHTKGFEYSRLNDSIIKLDLRLFTEGHKEGVYELPYDVVVGVFDGDWHDAADIYRNWVQNSSMPLPPKAAENPALPEWYFQSPVVVTYSVRGTRDLGPQPPNKMFPYTNALPYINRFNEVLGSPVMALLMHWEGSAPWAPRYVWPPYGGEKMYREFVDSLHARGNLAGLYASGTGYTLKSNTDPIYEMYDEFERLGLKSIMKVAPDGSVIEGGVCAAPWAQRLGHDMCPANDFVKKTVANQISQILASNTDYVQYFDQNLGGACYYCYGTSHGHPYGPGVWMNEAMESIYDTCAVLTAHLPRKVLIGCEAAAAEPFLRYLFFNDGRASCNLAVGTPVPLYAYIYHEYLTNFMGNQNGVENAIDVARSPHNFLQRLAMAFCTGDMLTVILRDDGSMIWGWSGSWEIPGPDQNHAETLIRNLNGWRRGAGRDFLTTGRMEKPRPAEGFVNVPMITRPAGREIRFPSVMTSAWSLPGGRGAQFLVNYLPERQIITLNVKDMAGAQLFALPGQQTGQPLTGEHMEIALEPLSAAMITYGI